MEVEKLISGLSRVASGGSGVKEARKAIGEFAAFAGLELRGELLDRALDLVRAAALFTDYIERGEAGK